MLNHQLSEQKLTLIGELSQHTVMTLPKNLLKQSVAQSNLRLDASQVNKVDSAGLAWLLLLIEKANTANCQLTIAHLSDDALKLARLSGVEQFLPLAQ